MSAAISSPRFKIWAGTRLLSFCDHSFENADGKPSANKVIPLDVTNAAQVHAAIQSQRPTHVVHLAAITAPSLAERDIRKTWNVNLGGTLNVALSVADAAPNCRFIFCSSAEVYGASFHDGKHLDEKALLKPASVYGATKAAADLLVGQMALQNLKAVRLRPFNHTGPGQSEQFAVPSFAAQIARIERGEQEPVIRVGNLSSRKDFLDVRDIVRAYIAVILRFDDLPIGAVFNIASGRTVSMGEILDQLISLASRKNLSQTGPAPLRQGEAFTVSGNANAFRRALNWEPQVEPSSTLSIGPWATSEISLGRELPCGKTSCPRNKSFRRSSTSAERGASARIYVLPPAAS